jgi:hypothetical protein
MSQDELPTFRKYIDENLEKGFIQHSKFLIGAPISFVKKKDGSLWMHVNYRGLNWFTIKNRYRLPLISRLLDQVSCAKMYTKIDLFGAYNLVRTWKGDEWKTTFETCYNHFKYVVMPFGLKLTNTLAIFQHLMNDVFLEYVDDFVVCYTNDIIFFQRTWGIMNTMYILCWKSFKNWINALLTPWGTQMWVQTENNKRVRSQGTFPNSQHFGRV